MLGPISSRMIKEGAAEASKYAGELHERLLLEQVKHYQATKNPSVAKRGLETTREYITCISRTYKVSEDFLKYLGMEKVDVEKIKSKLEELFSL